MEYSRCAYDVRREVHAQRKDNPKMQLEGRTHTPQKGAVENHTAKSPFDFSLLLISCYVCYRGPYQIIKTSVMKMK